jgi:prepilin-type N-terminal cleavage/methylation domain-containing protein/prepilin-type processing-associated H-X9-DG protein
VEVCAIVRRPQNPMLGERRNKSGFTLVEVSVVGAIIVILAALLVPVAGRFSIKASSAQSASNLRAIHIAIMSYANDNGGYLPGPLFAGQGPSFGITPPGGVSGALAVYLSPYLPFEQTGNRGFSRHFVYSAWSKHVVDKDKAPSYQMMAPAIRVQGIWRYPFGRKGSGGSPDVTQTMTLMQLSTWLNDPSVSPKGRRWLTESDGLLNATSPNPPGWRHWLPPEPVHGNHRNTLFYDGSVQAVPIAEF